MKNPIITFIKKYWLTVWTVFMILALSSMIIASADYPSSLPSMKRVVASTSDYGRKFSSNILIEGGANTYIPDYKEALTDTTSTYDVEVNIWNYSLKNPLDWYKEHINYTISFALTNRKGEQLTEGIGDRTVAVYENGSTTPLITLSASKLDSLNDSLPLQKLTYSAGNSDSDTYVLKFKGTWNLTNDEDICVQMVATPDKDDIGNSYNDLTEIGAIIGLKPVVSGGESGWTAYLNENPDSSTTIDVNNYDGYNLILTGSGAAVITVTWNTENMELNRYFTDSTLRVYSFGTFSETDEENQVITTPEVIYSYNSSSKIATLTIHADSGSDVTNHRTRYNIQIYKTESYEPQNWEFFAVKKGTVQDAWYDTADIKVEINENTQ